MNRELVSMYVQLQLYMEEREHNPLQTEALEPRCLWQIIGYPVLPDIFMDHGEKKKLILEKQHSAGMIVM